MPKLSRIPVEQRRMTYFISNLWNAFTLIDNRDETVRFLQELLSPTEIRMFAKRVQIAKMLLEGHQYPTIKSHVRVTDSTISSVSNQIQYGNGGYSKILNKLIKIETDKRKKAEGHQDLLDPNPHIGRATPDWILNEISKEAKNILKRKSVTDSLN
jgi:TrpR-related protein YerC/YecD